MMLQIPNVLTPEQVQKCREALLNADWSDGRDTAGEQAARIKRNLQLPPHSELAQQMGNAILDIIGRNPTFIAATLPLKVLPPLFNRYEGGGTYGNHIDNAIHNLPGSAHRVRTDISTTLFLTDPADYDGGELVVQDTYGEHRVKLPAGHMIIYPGTSLHRVEPVTRGARISSFFWIQSLVADVTRRATLYELDQSIQQLTADHPDHPSIVRLTGTYHNLLRMWSQT